MANKISLLILFVLVSCGREVSLDTSKLESYSNVTDSESLKVDQQGTLIRGTPDRISTTSGSLKVSPYSSHLALTFISQQAPDARISVKFKGKINGNTEVALELIEAN